MSDEFKVGDVVVLKSGGPRMTVNAVWDQGIAAGVECKWFYDGDLRTANFKRDCLEYPKTVAEQESVKPKVGRPRKFEP